MKNLAKLALQTAVVLGLTVLGLTPDLQAGYITDPIVESVVRGDQTYAFPAGAIRADQPLDGVVNQVTGDNQVTGNRMISGGTHSFYLRLNLDQEPTVGALYTVYRRTHKVYHPATRQYLGELIQRLGVVKLTDVEGRLAVGKLVASFNSIGPGDHLVRFTPPEEVETPQPVSRPAPGAEGMVVDFVAYRTLTGQRQVVYIDRGRSDGFRTGDRLQLYRVGGGLPRRVLGEVKVIATEDTTSTVLVTKAIAPLLVGDRVAMKTPTPDRAAELESLPITEKEQVRELAKKIDDLARESEGRSSAYVDQSGRRVVVNLDEKTDHLYFDSGEAVVKADGIPLLKQIGDMLKEMPDQQIRVEGHADSQEIGPSLKSKFPTNWELSKARAAGVAHYFIQESGLDADRLTSVGYGATQPVAPNTTEEGRQRNRRVEIVIQPADAAKQTEPEPPTFTEQSVPSKSAGTTLSTVATPSLNDGAPAPSAPDGAMSTSNSTADANPPAAGSDAVTDPTAPVPGSAPDVPGPTSQADAPATDSPVTDPIQGDDKTSGLPLPADVSPQHGTM